MSLTMVVLFFFGITLGLVAVPFLPSLFEWRKRTDDRPLRVVRDSEVDIRHFAEGFRAYIETHLKMMLDACRDKGESIEGVLEDRTGYIVVPDEESPVLNKKEQKKHTSERMILSCGNLKLPAKTMYPLEIYAGDSMQGGEENIYRAIFAKDRIRMSDRSISLRWLHAGGVVHARTGCILYGRVSADGGILLADGCFFERLNAPRIEFGSAPETDKTDTKQTDNTQLTILKSEEIPNVVEVAAGRWLVDNKLDIPPEKLVETNLVTTGWARVGHDCRIAGSIKSRKDLHLKSGVEVQGSVVSERNLHIGEGCRILGPVLAEGNIFIQQGTILGSPDIPTTVSGKGIFIASGTMAYGTVWGHKEGRICSPKEVSKREKNRNWK